MSEDPKPWSKCSSHELLDMAQVALEEGGPETAAILVAAAHVIATASIEWTIENRLLYAMAARQ